MDLPDPVLKGIRFPADRVLHGRCYTVLVRVIKKPSPPGGDQKPRDR